jgi:hypothetical protein
LKIVSDPAQIKDLHELLGDFCHQVRNRLHMLNMELYFAKVASHDSQRSEWAILEQSYRAVERVVDHLQTICRPMPLTLLSMSLDILLEDRRQDWSCRLAARDLSLELKPPADTVVGLFDPSRLAHALDAWALFRSEQAASGTVIQVSWGRRDGHLTLEWQETAPSCGPSPQTTNITLTESVRMTSLALPLLARVMTAHGGHLKVVTKPDWNLHLRWPENGQATS